MVSTRSRILGLCILLVSALVLASCGGNATYSPTVSGATGTTTPVTLTISPSPAYCIPGHSVNVSATVTGTSATQVTWSILNGGEGTITSTGADTATYSVPPNDSIKRKVTDGAKSTAHPSGGTSHTGPVTIQAVLTSNTSITATATVNVQDVVITITPTAPNVVEGTTQQFTAVVTLGGVKIANQTVTWYTDGGSPGKIDQNTGVFTAAYKPGETNVLCESAADTSIQAYAEPNTVPPSGIAVSVNPTSKTILTGTSITPTATVTGVPAAGQAVTWSLTDSSYYGSFNTTTGTYTAPGSFPSGVTTATVHIEATSVADPTKTAICTVTIING